MSNSGVTVKNLGALGAYVFQVSGLEASENKKYRKSLKAAGVEFINVDGETLVMPVGDDGREKAISLLNYQLNGKCVSLTDSPFKQTTVTPSARAKGLFSAYQQIQGMKRNMAIMEKALAVPGLID